MQPILTIMLNTPEAGIVKEIVAEEGDAGRDALILTLQNPELEEIEEKQEEWEQQRILYQEKRWRWSRIDTLQQQALQAAMS